jgi:hypothetical protein
MSARSVINVLELSVWQLYAWYKRYGFVPNPDYTSKREMILIKKGSP